MQTVKNTHFHPSSIRRVWVNYICSDFLMQVKCLSSGSPVKKRNTLLRSYHNAKSGTTYNVVPLLSSDSPPGERTGCGLDDRPRKGRNERERNNWRDSSVLLRPTVCILPEIRAVFLNRPCYFWKQTVNNASCAWSSSCRRSGLLEYAKSLAEFAPAGAKKV